jgi:redox-sensing transcriptional repressor
MTNYIIKNKIEIGIITVPDIAGQQVLDLMITAGIKGVLNFAPIQLKAPKGCLVHNVNLALELENLIYFTSYAKQDNGL